MNYLQAPLQTLLINSLGLIADISVMRLSASCRQCPLEIGGIGGGGWVHPKGANTMATPRLISRSNLVGTGRAISIVFGINGVRNKQSHLEGPPFPAFKAHFSAMAG